MTLAWYGHLKFKEFSWGKNLTDHPRITGVINATAPYQTGALLIGTETELILKSRWVLPTRLIEEGYVFQFPRIADAINERVS